MTENASETASPQRFQIRNLISWLILILSYSFLVYKIFTFNHYSELAKELQQMPLSKLWWLVAILTLVPVNWIIESLKWKMLVGKVQKISLINSFQAVLSGISTGFFTPNRVGELVGRVLFLKNENRKAGVTLSLVNSLTQNLMMALCGIPACILFYICKNEKLKLGIVMYLGILILCLILFGTLYFILPVLIRRIKLKKLATKLLSYTACLSDYSEIDLLRIMLITLLRYCVFCAQFYFMLLLFGVNLEIWQALIAIPTSYLFVSFTPSIAFSEAAVRSSYAVLIIGAFSTMEIPIMLAGVSIWFVNFVIPMLAGSIVLVKEKN